jgi:ADP-heptose:LPS heptosyltransferase
VEIRPPSGIAAFPEYPGYSSPRVRHVASVIEAADCFVCADSGLMHLGSATDTATVGLFKVTDPRMYAPYGGANVGITAAEDAAPLVAAHVARLLAEDLRARLPV